MSNQEQQFIAITDGVRLQVSSTGTGDPLVLVCGTCQDHRMWGPLLPALAERYRVITYNHRGIGDSERGTGPITVTSLMEDLNALLEALDVKRAHLLGWSLGSAVLQELAIAYPQRVASQVLAFTWGRSSAFQASLWPILAHPWRTGDRAVAIAGMGLAFSPELLESAQFGPVMAQFEPLFPRTPSQIATAAEQWDADLGHDALDQLPRISAPTLVVAGELDLMTPPALGRAVAEAIPGARYELLTGSGASHAAPLERPQEVADLVLDFLGEQSFAPAQSR
jgi:pimeloyl-ACP methyl ester carboxylesterase